MSATKLERLKQAAKLTDAMLLNAQSERWSELPSQQQEREALFLDIFPLDAVERTDDFRQIILTMIEQNQQLETVCRQAQKSLQLELSGLNKNRKAVAAYQSS